MVEVDQIISVVPKHGFNVPGTRDPSRALYEKTISAMGESLTEQCRVEVEGLRVVNFFSRRRSNDGIWGISIG